MTLEALTSLDRSTLRERALLVLRSAITSGQYRPGEHLSEVEIATRLGVSRGTVREALRHLQQEGLVVAGSRGMLRVTSLSAAQVRELYEVRAALESLAATRIISSPERPAAVAALRQALQEMARVEGDVEEQIEADLALHLRLVELSGNSMLLRAWRHLEGPIRVTIMHAGPERAIRNMAVSRHAPIVDALEHGSAEEVADLLRTHMHEAVQQLVDALGEG